MYQNKNKEKGESSTATCAGSFDDDSEAIPIDDVDELEELAEDDDEET
jgi:hypothetical protein